MLHDYSYNTERSATKKVRSECLCGKYSVSIQTQTSFTMRAPKN